MTKSIIGSMGWAIRSHGWRGCPGGNPADRNDRSRAWSVTCRRTGLMHWCSSRASARAKRAALMQHWHPSPPPSWRSASEGIRRKETLP
jgi:hypothetical protein